MKLMTNSRGSLLGGTRQIHIMKYICIIAMALTMAANAQNAEKPIKVPAPKFEFLGKLVSKERVNVGRGAAFGKFFRDKLKFEIVKVTKGDLKPGVIAPCEIGGRRGYVSPVAVKDAKVGQLYRIDALYKHPAHADGLYLLNGRIHQVAKQPDAPDAPAKPAAKPPVPAKMDHKYLKAFPKAAEGMSRFVIALPDKTRGEEGAFKVELIVGRMMDTDGVNRMFLGGKLEPKPLKGWGFTYYEAQLGPAASTLIGVPPGTPPVHKFVQGPSQLIRYNCRIPIVVYVPKGAEVRYRIWSATPETKKAPKN